VPRGARDRWLGLSAAFLVVGLLAAASLAVTPARAGIPPPLPLALDRGFVSDVTGVELAPGSAGEISLRVANPLPAPMSATLLTVAVYAFNAFPGNATSEVGLSSPPILTNASASGPEVNETVGDLNSGQTVSLSIPVQTAASTPAGTFAVRTELRFVENATSYLLESRGWFTAATWAAATAGPNGSADVNLTELGVSGILPETSILVQSNNFAYVLWGIFAAALVVLAVGSVLYFRRSNSSSGT